MRHLNRNDKFNQQQKIQNFQEAQSRAVDFYHLMMELAQADLAIRKKVKCFLNRSRKNLESKQMQKEPTRFSE